MSFRQIRKLPGMDNIVKDLAEKLQRALADQGVEDVTLFRQNRVEYDAIAFTDTGGGLDAAMQASDMDAVSYADAETVLRQDSGRFEVVESEAEDGAGVTQPILVGFWDVGE